MNGWRYPVPYAHDSVPVDGPCRVIVQNGQLTNEATPEERERLAGKLAKPCRTKKKRGGKKR